MEIDSSTVEVFENLSKESTDFAKQCAKLSNDISSNRITIVQLIDDLGPLLVNNAPEKRALGTQILSDVIESLPVDFLNSTQLNFISTFYSDRLKDHHQVIPAVLKGIKSLINHDNLPDGVCSQLLAFLFHNVPCQQQQQTDRNVIYNIFKSTLEKKHDELRAMGLDLVYGVISAMDSERDPRNLLFLFNWLPVFVTRISLGHLSEEMFEVMACYFPVDFRVPSQDENSISRDQLAAALTPCLCATPDFADLCIPLALEKLGSSLRIAKMDSLHLLLNGCKNFSEELYLLHSTEIWSLIQQEVLNTTHDTELESLCLQTLSAVTRKISESNTDTFKTALSNITDTLKGNLIPDAKLFAPTTKLLLAVTAASLLSASYIITEIAPQLTNLYNITTNLQNRVLVFNVLISFTHCYIKTHNNPNLSDITEISTVPNMCLQAAVHSENELKSVGLRALSCIVKSLPEATRMVFYESLKLYITTQQVVHKDITDTLKVFAMEYPDEIKGVITNVETVCDVKSYYTALSVIAGLEDFTGVVMPILLGDLNVAALEAIRDVVVGERGNATLQDYVVNKVDVIRTITRVTLDCTDCTMLVVASDICKEIVGYQTSAKQAEIVGSNLDLVMPVFKGGNKWLVFMLDGLLGRLRRDVVQDFGVLDDLVDVALNGDGRLHDVSVQLLANLVNKLNDDDKLLAQITRISLSCEQCMANTSDAEIIKKACSITAWMTKALAMRGHVCTNDWSNRLISLLDNHQSAAMGFKIVLSEDSKSLAPISYSNQRLLYRQRFFTEASAVLNDKYSENSNHLLAFGYMLEVVPYQILKVNFMKVIRLIILCVDNCKDSQVLLAVLTSIKLLLETKDETGEKYIQEFIPRLLKLAQFKESLTVRIVALQCISLYASSGFTLYKLLPLKTDIIQILGECLDDHKRLVRKEAVEARLKWYLIDAPT